MLDKLNKLTPRLVVLIFGLYPFFHYYNSNISEATSWQQIVFMISLCFVLPQLLYGLKSLIFKIRFLKFLEPYYLSVFSLSILCGLIGFLTFFPQKKKVLLCLLIGVALGWLLKKHLSKIIIIQLLMNVMALVGFVPQLFFHNNFHNETWTTLTQEELNTKFVQKPNIFVIQPDGYVNFSDITEQPYNYDNSKFKNWLISKGFKNYNDFKSNYYSTLTSNSSMFAMKHHYYTNTNRSTLKTHKANEVIVGKYNNVLKILNQNDYTSYLISDNSYFLIDRATPEYNFTNINTTFMSYHSSGLIKGVDILNDIESVLDTVKTRQNFFFIEKTVPSHINYSKSNSLGVEGERIRYINRLEEANQWLKDLVIRINNFDKDALIIIIADHGGFVGMEYSMDAVNHKLNTTEVVSAFSSLLSIKWPKNIKEEALNYESNVNLFRNLFFELSGNSSLIINKEENSSFMPLKENGEVNYYEYINDLGEFVFKNIRK